MASLSLERRAASSAVLADGSTRFFDVYAAELEWDGSMVEVLLSAIGNEPLIGMKVFRGYEMKIEIKVDGVVQAQKLT